MARPVIILFAKAPRLGTVKRRLAAGIGDVPALRFARNMLSSTIRKFSRLRGYDLVLAITPDHARLRLPPRWQPIGQGHGDLGMRMDRAFRRYPGRRVILVGTDIPALSASDIRAAIKLLGSRNTVFGPALDGGYYLVAMAARRPAKPFDNVRWSSPHALADTVQNFAGMRVEKLRMLSDVDSVEDFKKHFFL